jgi:hydrogenase maturation factor HypF (carbamoyltransferase family)
LEAERAITQALALLRQESPPLAEIDQVDAALRGALSDIDRFWVRWSHYRESQQGRDS